MNKINFGSLTPRGDKIRKII